MSIPLIHVDDVGSVQIQNVTVPNYHVHQPNVNHLTPPVVVNIGNPIIDMLVVSKHTKIINIIRVDYLLIGIL